MVINLSSALPSVQWLHDIVHETIPNFPLFPSQLKIPCWRFKRSSNMVWVGIWNVRYSLWDSILLLVSQKVGQSSSHALQEPLFSTSRMTSNGIVTLFHKPVSICYTVHIFFISGIPLNSFATMCHSNLPLK